MGSSNTMNDMARQGAGAAPEPARGSAWGHHGIWSPGVLLFRRVRFGAKAGVISAVFVLVLLQLLVMLIWPMVKTLHITESERVGVAVQLRLLRDVLPHTATVLQDAADKGKFERAALERMAAGLGSAGNEAKGQFDLNEPFKFVRQAAEPLAQPAADRDEAFSKADNLLQQLLRAMASVSDLSLLSTEPDHVSHGLMEFATQDGLQMYASIRRVAELGAAAQGTGEVSPATRRIVQGETYLLLREVEALFGYFDGQAKDLPELGTALAHLEAFNTINAFIRMTRRALPAEGAAPGDGSALRAAGQKAGDELLGLAARSLLALDTRLADRLQSQRYQLWLQGGLVLLGLATAAYLFYCFYLVTHGGMLEIKRHIDGMAAGRLDTHPHAWGRDEAADVLLAMHEMQASMRTLVGDVRACAGDILTFSNQVSQGAVDLSQRSERSAARVQSSASTMSTIADRSRDTAAEVQRSAGLSRTGASNAADSQQSFGQLAARIQQLRGSSLKVGEIVGVIDSIAFQTNILALNAAVEAARAGEQGRGFAVVASEVRALAQRSAAAAREIKDLVGQSSEHTERGTEAVQVTGQAVERLVNDMQTISVALEQVATRQADQVHQVQAVAASFTELDHDAQQNAALVEQTTASAINMRQRAEQLAQAAGRFTL